MSLVPTRTARRGRRLLASAVATLAVSAVVPALAPAAVAAAAPQPPLYNARAVVPGGFEQVQLALAPRDAPGLAELARIAHTVAPAQRQAQRLAALAGPDRAGQVARIARTLGLTLISTSDTSVTVAGKPALVRSLFGSARANRPDLPTAQDLPTLPPAFTGLVLVAAGGDETRPAFLPRPARPRNTADGSLSQAELQSVYGVPAGQAPPTASSPTVATIQFGDWNDSDLTTFTRQNQTYGAASYDPVASGGYTRVTVAGGNNDFSASGEVALDQEAIATIAPGVRQRAYFTPNTAMGMSQALNQVAQDASTYHILAVSTSYGSCEADAYTGPNDPQLQVDVNAVNNAIAAGVTMFGASGDNGSVDCPSTHPGQNTVDVPAALPNVVSVGGTRVVTNTGGTTQTAWGCTSASASCRQACASQSNGDGGCTGGGYSALFARPAYQSTAVTNAMRGVPDIAMDGSPQTGLDTYDSNPVANGGCGGACGPTGGTSLATPLAAAALASVLTSQGATAGLGDIHNLLYQAPASAFTDITVGSNGAYSAGPGWDPVTGLGSPMWSTLLQPSVPAGSTQYVPINPTRMLDTRTGLGGLGSSGLVPDHPYAFNLAATTSLPANATAYAFNVAAIGPNGVGNLRVAPGTGSSVPSTALITYQPGHDSSNFVVLQGAQYTLYSDTAAVNVTMDLVGYYTAGYTGLPTFRVADTRTSQGGAGPVAGGTTRSFQVGGATDPAGDTVPSTATAVALNVTAVGPGGVGNLRVYPDVSGATAPNAANITYIPGVTKSAYVVVQLPTDGKIDVYSDGSAADVVIDAFGYYTSSSNLVTQTPVRVLDTRTQAQAQGLPHPLAANNTYTLQVGGMGGVPADAQAALISVTAVHAPGSTGVGNLRVFPGGTSPPNAANINYVGPTADVANFVIAKLGPGGSLSLYSDGSPIDVTVDVVGYVPAGS